MQIKGFIQSTLIDWEGVISSIIFLPGCNFRCRYCHSASLVLDSDKLQDIDINFVIEFLKSKKGWIDGLVITGGEPTIYPELLSFIKKFKDIDIKIKLDTNGSNPEILKELLDNGLVDYIAMDIKAPFDKEAMTSLIGVEFDLEIIKESIQIIMDSNINYEFRTTISKALLSVQDIIDISSYIKGAKRYRLQKFKIADDGMLDKKLKIDEEFSEKEYNKILEQTRIFVSDTQIR